MKCMRLLLVVLIINPLHAMEEPSVPVLSAEQVKQLIQEATAYKESLSACHKQRKVHEVSHNRKYMLLAACTGGAILASSYWLYESDPLEKLRACANITQNAAATRSGLEIPLILYGVQAGFGQLKTLAAPLAAFVSGLMAYWKLDRWLHDECRERRKQDKKEFTTKFDAFEQHVLSTVQQQNNTFTDTLRTLQEEMDTIGNVLQQTRETNEQLQPKVHEALEKLALISQRVGRLTVIDQELMQTLTQRAQPSSAQPSTSSQKGKQRRWWPV